MKKLQVGSIFVSFEGFLRKVGTSLGLEADEFDSKPSTVTQKKPRGTNEIDFS
jgi:hypothetical protein